MEVDGDLKRREVERKELGGLLMAAKYEDAETIKLDFELPSSSYATVCLRELMKNDMIMACDSDYGDWKEFLHSVKQSLLETAGQTRSAKRPLDIEEGNEKSAKKQK